MRELQMNTDALVSVIVPIYNSQEYLKECLEAIGAQLYKNLEILLIDDGSTDDSGKIAEEYAQKDERTKVVHKVHSGISESRNMGLDLASGEWIFFVDSDDKPLQNAIQELLYAAQVSKSKIAMGGHYVWKAPYETGTIRQMHVRETVLKNVEEVTHYFLTDGRNMLMLWAKLFHKSVFANVRFKPGKMYEDIYAFPDILEGSGSLVTVDEALYLYRIHEGSTVFDEDPRTHMDGLYAVIHFREHINRTRCQFLPDVNDLVLEFCCYLMGKLTRLGREKNPADWQFVTEQFEKSRKSAAKRKLALKGATLLFRISPVHLGILCCYYSKKKNM